MQIISPRPNSLAQNVYFLLCSFSLSPLLISSHLTTPARSQLAVIGILNHPWVIQHLLDSRSRAHVPVQHLFDEIDTWLTHHVWDSQVAIHDLVDAVERVLFVDYGVEENTKGPDVLLFAVVGLAG